MAPVAVAGLIRAIGSGMLRKGTVGAGVQAGVKKIGVSGIANVALKGKGLMHLAETAAGIFVGNKMMAKLANSSPALKQQLIILGKSFSLLLRPIGDIMAKFVRPMAVWMMKFAMRWYQLFGGGGATKESADWKEDRLKQLNVELESATMEKDQPRIYAIKEEMSKVSSGEKEGPKRLSELLGEGIGAAADTLGKAAIAPVEDVGGALMTAIDATIDGWKKAANFLDIELGAWLTNIGDTMASDGQKIIDFITNFPENGQEVASKVFDGFESIGLWLEDWRLVGVSWLEKMKTWFSDWSTVLGSWVTDAKQWLMDWGSVFKGMGQTLFDMVKDGVTALIDKIKSWRPWWLGGGDDPDEKPPSEAVGGKIQTTGLYNLHAGEEVIRSGDAARNNNAGSTNVTNYINVAATINNDMDIQTLAKRLAEYSEIELRRRTSYI